MGMADRRYTGSGQTTSRLTPVVKGLLIANAAVFVLDMLMGGKLTQLGAFRIASGVFGGRLWEFLTFQFLHGSLGHILFNSIALYFFGPWMERWWGAAKFLVFYLLCGMAGAAFYTLLTFAGVLNSPYGYVASLVGASAGIYGILIGVALVAPGMRVALLFPPIELSMRQLALAVVGIATVMVLFNLANAGGEAGHLGGAILGYFLVRRPGLLGWVGRRSPEVEIVRPKAFDRRSEAKIRPRTTVSLDESTEIDRILDKISREGFQSLNETERALLEKAAQSHPRQP